jgi:hypothetical protein
MSRDRGFDDIQLMELGFKQLVTNETNFELSQGNLYTLMLLTDYNEITIRNATDFKAITRILSNQ